MTTPAPDTLRLVPVSLIADTMNWMARAYERIHGLPRISDTDLADKVGAAKERLRPYLDAPAVQPAEGREEIVKIVSRGFVGQQVSIDGGRFYVVGLDGKRVDGTFATYEQGMEHLNGLRADAILAAISTPAQASETGGEMLARITQALVRADEEFGNSLSAYRYRKLAEAVAALSAPQAAPGEGEQS